MMGLYKVLKCTRKYYTLDIQTCSVTVSLDRLKPAHREPLILQHQLHHHPTYRLTLSQTQPHQHLHHELLAPNNRFTGLIAFTTESCQSLWWGSSCGVQYTQTHCVVLYTGFSICYFGLYVKSCRLHLSSYFPVFVMWLNIADYSLFQSIGVCVACPVPFCV